MAQHDLIAREFAGAFMNPALAMSSLEPYTNSNNQPGMRWSATLGRRRFYVSESSTTTLSTPSLLAHILTNPDFLDYERSIVYTAHRRWGVGIRIEAWYRGRWYQVFTPIEGWPSDFLPQLFNQKVIDRRN